MVRSTSCHSWDWRARFESQVLPQAFGDYHRRQNSALSPGVLSCGLDIITVATTRNLINALNPAIKSLNYLNNILAKIEAITADAKRPLCEQ